MPELLIQPLVFGSGLAYIGLSPGACYSFSPDGDQRKRRIMTTLHVASAVTAYDNVIIPNEQTGGVNE